MVVCARDLWLHNHLLLSHGRNETLERPCGKSKLLLPMLARARTIARVPVAQHLRSTRKRTSSAVLRNLSSSFLPVRTEPILLVSVARYSTDATGAKTRAHPYDQPVSVVSEITEESTESLSMENKSDVASEPVSNLISAAPAMWLELFADEFGEHQY